MTKTMLLVGGVSGTGKTTFTDYLLDLINGTPDGVEIFSTDDFWGEDYNFDMSKLKEAHAWNQDRTEKALISGVDSVIVHNTFCSDWETKAYRDMAERSGYRVISVMMNPVDKFQDVHSVPPFVKVNQLVKVIKMFVSRLGKGAIVNEVDKVITITLE